MGRKLREERIWEMTALESDRERDNRRREATTKKKTKTLLLIRKSSEGRLTAKDKSIN